MAQYRVAKRYAKGFMDYLAVQDKKEAANKEMTNLSHLIQENRDLRSFLSSPVLDHKKKALIAQELFSSYSQESKTFIQLVIKQGRSAALHAIAESFQTLYRKERGIQKAVITSAVALTEDKLEHILAKVKQELPADSTLEVENKIDEQIIGGFILRVGDRQWDASVQSKLENLKKKFDTRHYIKKF